MNIKLARAVQRVLLAINRRRWGLAFNRWAYRRATRLAALLLSGRGVAACYVRGSVGRGNIVPGLSDIDFHVVAEEMDDTAFGVFAERLAPRIRRAKALLPMLNVYVVTVKDFEAAIRTGTLYYNTPGEDWVRYAGRAVIAASSLPPAGSMIAWTKVLIRRFFGIQKRHVGREPGSRRHAFLKVNENLLLDARRLLGLLGVDDPSLARLERIQDELREAGYSVEELAFYDRIFPEWYALLKAAGGRIDPALPASAVDARGFRAPSAILPPATRDRVRTAIRPFVEALDRATGAFKVALAFSAVPNRNYNFKLYLVTRDDAPIDEVMELRRALHKVAWSFRPTFPADHFSSFPSPLIVPEALFRHLGLSDNGGLEPHYWRRHGEVLFNRLGRDLPPMDETASLASALSEGVIHLGYARRRRDLPEPGPKFATSLVDHVTGTLPAQRLLLEKRIIATTPAEATRDYVSAIGGEYGDLLAEFAGRHAGADPASLDTAALASWYRDHFAAIKRQADAITTLHLERLRGTMRVE